MSEAGENVTPLDQGRRLSDAIRDVKNAAADRDDVVVEMREASRMRLDLLAAELAPVFAEVPADVDIFDFAVSSGLQPRLWIDAVSHVTMGRDRRTYRFLRDTRIGRVVLAESTDMKPVADQVTLYVAERIVERQRLMDGSAEPAIPGALKSSVAEASEPLRAKRNGWAAFLSGLGLVVAGALVGLAASVALLWDRLAAMGIGF
ncbi:MAG TPA: hypothetical protein VGX71_11015 [Pseudaminobacter sp.]|jgi:hypothetical protein|nr:hypothetical protein [Pseudaminobacter sp.]